MLKKLHSILFLSYVLCAWHHVDALTTSLKDVIIATDLDHVLLESNTWERVSGSVSSPAMLWSYLQTCRKYREAGKAFSRTCGESLYIKEVTANNGKENKAAAFVRMRAQEKRIMNDTLELFKTLHAQGATLYTATNIGSVFFNDLKKKFPDIFNESFIKHAMTVDYGASDVIEKPDIRYFMQLKEIINPHDSQRLLFIDDKLENVEAARKVGFMAIHFKNAKQLKEDLEKLLQISLEH